MQNTLGLVEMALVLGVTLGWGVFELLSVRRKRPPPKPDADDGIAPP